MVDVRIEEREAIATAVVVVPDASHWKEGLDRVWEAVRAGGLPAGRNVMRSQRAERRDTLGRVRLEVDAGVPSGKIVAELQDVSMRYGERVEVGVELSGHAGDLVASELPAGPTAVGLRVGELSPQGIAEAHDAVRAWCSEHGHEVTGECWEIYGHMNVEPFEPLAERGVRAAGRRRR